MRSISSSGADFCDWYLEIVKLRLDFATPTKPKRDEWAPQAALTTCCRSLKPSLRLLSPFMPFLTEELWHALYDGNAPAKSIALTRYPQADGSAIDAAVERGMADLQELIVTLRALRKDLDVPEREEIAAEIFGAERIQSLAATNRDIISKTGAGVICKIPCDVGASFHAFKDNGELYSWLPVREEDRCCRRA